MSDIARQLAEIVFSKEYFLSSARAGCEGILKMIGEDVEPELMDLAMGLYAKEYSVYFDVQVQTFDDVYTPEEMKVLLSFYGEHPWFIAKGALLQKQTIENNLGNGARMVENMSDLVKKFMDETMSEE